MIGDFQPAILVYVGSSTLGDIFGIRRNSWIPKRDCGVETNVPGIPSDSQTTNFALKKYLSLIFRSFPIYIGIPGRLATDIYRERTEDQGIGFKSMGRDLGIFTDP